jgi:hypothetical protein
VGDVRSKYKTEVGKPKVGGHHFEDTDMDGRIIYRQSDNSGITGDVGVFT